jgi:hypothetical protein
MNSLEAFTFTKGLLGKGLVLRRPVKRYNEAAATECDIRTAVDLGAGPGASAVFLRAKA